MNYNPPPVIVMYRKTLNPNQMKNYTQLWQNEPNEVKQLFSQMYQALKQCGKQYDQILDMCFEELETNDDYLGFDGISSISQHCEHEPVSMSFISVFHQIDGGCNSAFLCNNTFQSIEALCDRLKKFNLGEEVSSSLDQSVISIRKLGTK